jgi:hypothetical protein
VPDDEHLWSTLQECYQAAGIHDRYVNPLRPVGGVSESRRPLHAWVPEDGLVDLLGAHGRNRDRTGRSVGELFGRRHGRRRRGAQTYWWLPRTRTASRRA